MEIWKPVLGNDAYEVSNQGRVRRAKAGKRTRVGFILAQSPDRWGYMRVRLAPEGKRHRRVHRLVWEAFNGPIPEGLEINHDDGVKANNRLSNLIPVTSSGNKKHAVDTGLAASGGAFGTANGSAKLNEDIVRQIRALRAEGMTGQAIADQLGLAKRTVQHVCAGNYWAWVV